MSTFDPFKPPTANLDSPSGRAEDSSGEVPASVIAILAETRPWIRLLIAFFVAGVALMVVAMVGVGFIGSTFLHGKRSAFSLAMLIPLGIVTLVYSPPVVFLSRCASSIQRLQRGGGLTDLEDALRSQKSFWKYVGILLLVLVALYAVIFVASKAGLFAH